MQHMYIKGKYFKMLQSKHALRSNWQSYINPRVVKLSFKYEEWVCVNENCFNITHNP
jgi:hypothetical protein